MEPLVKTAESLSKTLLTMNIDAKESAKVTDMMMSVINKTPASMSSLQEALKQSGASFANFANSTSKTGVALEEYKLKLFQTELAMAGSQFKMGRQGEQSGTSLRAMAAKLETLERTAKNLFNTDMKLYDVWVKMDEQTGKMVVSQGRMEGGFKATSDFLSSLVKEDAPKAIEMLSKMQLMGVISTSTLNKMFNMDIHSRNIMSKVA